MLKSFHSVVNAQNQVVEHIGFDTLPQCGISIIDAAVAVCIMSVGIFHIAEQHAVFVILLNFAADFALAVIKRIINPAVLKINRFFTVFYTLRIVGDLPQLSV